MNEIRRIAGVSHETVSRRQQIRRQSIADRCPPPVGRIEIEVRFLVDSFEDIRRKLVERGAHPPLAYVERVRFYDTDALDYDAVDVRIRTKEVSADDGSSVFVIEKKMKEPDIPAPGRPDRLLKVRREYPRHVRYSLPEAEECIAMMHPGAEEVTDWTYQKKREHWSLPGDASIELDTLIDLDGRRYVEIEADPGEIERLAAAFGLDWDTSVAQGYRSEHEEARR